MSCGYACINCGKCKGEVRPINASGTCPFCGTVNAPGLEECSSCRRKLPLTPGQKRKPKARAAKANPNQLELFKDE